MSAPITHGYYLADTDTQHGDPVFASGARVAWRQAMGASVIQPQRFDGVAIYEQGGRVVQRLVIRDFFTGAVLVRDL